MRGFSGAAAVVSLRSRNAIREEVDMRPIRPLIPTLGIVLGLWTVPSAWAQAPVYQSERGPYRVVTVVDGLQHIKVVEHLIEGAVVR